MTRKAFLNGALTFAAAKPWRMSAADGMSKPIALNVARPDKAPNLRFGVVSDVHVRTATGQYGTEALFKAFAWFRDQGADGVVIAGDMADHGMIAQLQYVADAWEKAFLVKRSRGTSDPTGGRDKRSGGYVRGGRGAGTALVIYPSICVTVGVSRS